LLTIFSSSYANLPCILSTFEEPISILTLFIESELGCHVPCQIDRAIYVLGKNVEKKDILLKQRKNKTFSYKSRFSRENLSQDQLERNSKTDRFTEKWQRERSSNQTKSKRGMSLGALFLILVLLLICMYILQNKFM